MEPCLPTRGGVPWTLAANAASQPHAAHAWVTAERANETAVACGSSASTTASQSSTNSPIVASQRAAGGSSTASEIPSGAGCAYAKKAARG